MTGTKGDICQFSELQRHIIGNVQVLPPQTYWTISQNDRQSKITTFLVVRGWLTCHTFCSLYGLYDNILQHVHVSAAAIHLHTKERATRGKERRNCQKNVCEHESSLKRIYFQVHGRSSSKFRARVSPSQAGEKHQPGFEMRNRNVVKVHCRSTSPSNRFAWTETGKFW